MLLLFEFFKYLILVWEGDESDRWNGYIGSNNSLFCRTQGEGGIAEVNDCYSNETFLYFRPHRFCLFCISQR